MNHSIEVIQVYYWHGTEKIFMGRLALKNRRIFFEYTADFLTTELALSPFKLPLKTGVIACEDHTFNGLFGLFNDSLPDGWGRLLLDRKLLQLGIQPAQLTPLDRLCYVGNNGMGALSYEPEISHFSAQPHQDLDEIAQECLSFQLNDSDQWIEDLLVMNGSSAGVRPKILVNIQDEKFLSENILSIAKNNHWIIKFQSPTDPKEVGAIEYAYHLMAQASGLILPEARLFKSKKTPGFFGVKRFDRNKSQRLHMHSVSGLLHIDHHIPSLDYETLMKLTLWLTKNKSAGEIQFRHAVFNFMTHNRDDHAKNFSFLLNEQGHWQVSPAYDLTFSSGPAGEHSTTIMGEGKNPTRLHLLKLAEIGGIKKTTALEIIDQVITATAQWKHFSEIAQVSKKSSSAIQQALQRLAKNF